MPYQRHELHLRICNLRYELTVIGGVPIKKGGDKIQSFSMSCDLPMIKGTSPGI